MLFLGKSHFFYLENLRKNIASFNPKLSDEELDYAIKFYEKQEIKKGELLIEVGQFVKHFYFVEKGCFCLYMLREGNEQVLEFYTENEVFTELYAYLEEKPTSSFIKAMEGATIYKISKKNVEEMFDHAHQLERFGRLMMQDYFLRTFRKTAHIRNRSNEERYLRLLAKRPDLFQRVPQYLIASYLGITPVGLSKLRKRLAKVS